MDENKPNEFDAIKQEIESAEEKKRDAEKRVDDKGIAYSIIVHNLINDDLPFLLFDDEDLFNILETEEESDCFSPKKTADFIQLLWNNGISAFCVDTTESDTRIFCRKMLDAGFVFTDVKYGGNDFQLSTPIGYFAYTFPVDNLGEKGSFKKINADCKILANANEILTKIQNKFKNMPDSFQNAYKAYIHSKEAGNKYPVLTYATFCSNVSYSKLHDKVSHALSEYIDCMRDAGIDKFAFDFDESHDGHCETTYGGLSYILCDDCHCKPVDVIKIKRNKNDEPSLAVLFEILPYEENEQGSDDGDVAV